MIDLKRVGEFLTNRQMWDKRLNELDRDGITELAEVFLSSIKDETPADGWAKPYIDEQGLLVIGHNCHPKYRWWTAEGQSVLDTLAELGASDTVLAKYTQYNGDDDEVPF